MTSIDHQAATVQAEGSGSSLANANRPPAATNETQRAEALIEQATSRPSASEAYRKDQQYQLEWLMQEFRTEATSAELHAMWEVLNQWNNMPTASASPNELNLLVAFEQFWGSKKEVIFRFPEQWIEDARAFDEWTQGGTHRTRTVKALIEIMASNHWLESFLRMMAYCWLRNGAAGLTPEYVELYFDEARDNLDDWLATARAMIKQYPDLVTQPEEK